jgi:hypothetical protein
MVEVMLIQHLIKEVMEVVLLIFDLEVIHYHTEFLLQVEAVVDQDMQQMELLHLQEVMQEQLDQKVLVLVDIMAKQVKQVLHHQVALEV